MHVEGEYWLVYDRLPSSAVTGDAWLSLQFAAGCVLRAEGDRSIVATVGDAQLQVTTSQGARELQVVRGERTPAAGWVSVRYGEMEPAPAVRIPTTDGPVLLATLVEPVTGDVPPTIVDTEMTDTRAIGVRVSHGEWADYLIVSGDHGEELIELFGVAFRGTGVWIRTRRGQAIECRTLGASEVRSSSLGLDCRIDSASQKTGYRWTPVRL